MKKILLLGELNETLRSLNEYLLDEFQVQMCSLNAKNVKDMIRIYRPAMLLFNITELNDDLNEIFDNIKTKLDTMPILIISTDSFEAKIKEFAASLKNYRIAIRPIAGDSILKHCHHLLNIEEDTAEEKKNIPTDNKIAPRILVVDDNALVLRNIKNMLENEYHTILANSGEKALDFAVSKRPDLILLDYDMPGMNGKETFEMLKENESTKDIPVVFLTSVAEKNQILAVLQNRPFGYILKPPTKDKIIKVIEEALKA